MTNINMLRLLGLALNQYSKGKYSDAIRTLKSAITLIKRDAIKREAA